MSDDKPHCETGAVKNTETSLIDKIIPKEMQPYETRYVYEMIEIHPSHNKLLGVLREKGKSGWKYCYHFPITKTTKTGPEHDRQYKKDEMWCVVVVRSYRHTIGDLLSDLVKDMKNIPIKKEQIPYMAKVLDKTEEETIAYLKEQGQKIEGDD